MARPLFLFLFVVAVFTNKNGLAKQDYQFCSGNLHFLGLTTSDQQQRTIVGENDLHAKFDSSLSKNQVIISCTTVNL